MSRLSGGVASPRNRGAGEPGPQQVGNWVRLIRQHIAHLPGSRAQLVRGQATYFVGGRPFVRMEPAKGELRIGLWLPPAQASQLLAAGQAESFPFDPAAVTLTVRRGRQLHGALSWIQTAYEHRRH